MGSGLIYHVEHVANPAFSNFFVTAYFVLVTLTTVGFGDLSPVTAVGRTVVCMTIILGGALLSLELTKVIEESHILDDTDNDQEDSTSSPLSQNDAQDASFQAEVIHRLNALAQEQQQLNLLVTQLHEQQQQQQPSKPASAMLSNSVSCSTCGTTVSSQNARFCYICGSIVVPSK